MAGPPACARRASLGACKGSPHRTRDPLRSASRAGRQLPAENAGPHPLSSWGRQARPLGGMFRCLETKMKPEDLLSGSKMAGCRMLFGRVRRT